MPQGCAITTKHKTAMKKLLIACLIALTAMAQTEPKVCKATKADGTNCKSTIIMQDGYCRVHSSSTPRCGATTSKGTACKMVVKETGDKCKHHTK